MATNKTQLLSIQRSKQIYSLLERLNLENFLSDFLLDRDYQQLLVFDEALTHTSANRSTNHERLEFLGDAVLRLAASEFIDYEFPKMAVGERSALRAQLVSDSWLSDIGQEIEIQNYLIIGAKALGDDFALRTIQAESTEALVGALYEYFYSIKPIHNWLRPYWEVSSKIVLQDPYMHNFKSALQEWSQSQGFSLPIYEIEERSCKHGDIKRFFSKVTVNEVIMGEGWGASRKDAEKEAARIALKNL